MNLNENANLRRVVDILKEFADCHEMLKAFSTGETAARGYNDDPQSGPVEEMKYPYLWVDFGPTVYNITDQRISEKVYNLKLFVADKQYDNIKSDDDIISDTEGILADAITYISTHPSLKKILFPDGSIAANLAREETKDNVFGWFSQVPIRVPYRFCYKNIPVRPKP